MSVTAETGVWVESSWCNSIKNTLIIEQIAEDTKQLSQTLFCDVPPRYRKKVLETFFSLYDMILNGDVYFVSLKNNDLKVIKSDDILPQQEICETINTTPSVDVIEDNFTYFSACIHNRELTLFNDYTVVKVENCTTKIQHNIKDFYPWGTIGCILLTDHDFDWYPTYRSTEIKFIVHTGTPSLKFLAKCKRDNIVVISKICIHDKFTINMCDTSDSDAHVAILDTSKHFTSNLTASRFHSYVQFPINYANFIPVFMQFNSMHDIACIVFDLDIDDHITQQLDININPEYYTKQIRRMQLLSKTRQVNTPTAIHCRYPNIVASFLDSGIFSSQVIFKVSKFSSNVINLFYRHNVLKLKTKIEIIDEDEDEEINKTQKSLLSLALN